MTDAERQALLDELDASARSLSAALYGIPEELAARAPASGSWSIHDCVEHLAISEEYLLGQLLAGEVRADPLLNERREMLIPVRGLDRSKPIQSPPAGFPAGRFPSSADAVAAFELNREATIRYVCTYEGDLRCRIALHPIMGAVNGYEMVLAIALHTWRHLAQIEEIAFNLAKQ